MNLVFDVDDTLVCTQPLLADKLMKRGVPVTYGTYLTDANTGGELSKLLDVPESYMTETPFVEHTYEVLDFFLAKGYTINVCTHRGFHGRGRALTEKLFADNDVHVDNLYALDKLTLPNKKHFLDAVFGAGNYILIDDRPAFDCLDTPLENCIYRTQPWNEHLDAPRFDCFTKLPALVFQMEETMKIGSL